MKEGGASQTCVLLTVPYMYCIGEFAIVLHKIYSQDEHSTHVSSYVVFLTCISFGVDDV